MKVPLVDLVTQYQNMKQEMDTAIHGVLDSGAFILGPAVKEFEKNMATYTGVKHAVGVASGTDAIQLALMAYNIGAGDEVITTPMTFVATVEVMVLLGIKPIFVDIDPKTYIIDPNQIEDKITSKTKAIVPVHLYGQCADMDVINDIAKHHNLVVIEDSAQAVGATYKGKKATSLGDTGCLSFFPSKNLGAYGDGGMVLTDDDDIADRVRKLRVHGSATKYQHVYLGVNSRLDSLQAAVLNVKLNYIDQWNEMRRQNAAKYNERLSESPAVTPFVAEYNTHTYHQYTIQVEDRDGLQAYLKENDIATGIHYPIPLHLQPAYENLGYKKGDFPVAEEVSSHVVSLPMYPELPEEHIDYTTEHIKKFLAK
jgi:dTDP-4-amino-4,6-dideoxygalactose transaminase